MHVRLLAEPPMGATYRLALVTDDDGTTEFEIGDAAGAGLRVDVGQAREAFSWLLGYLDRGETERLDNQEDAWPQDYGDRICVLRHFGDNLAGRFVTVLGTGVYGAGFSGPLALSEGAWRALAQIALTHLPRLPEAQTMTPLSAQLLGERGQRPPTSLPREPVPICDLCGCDPVNGFDAATGECPDCEQCRCGHSAFLHSNAWMVQPCDAEGCECREFHAATMPVG